MSTWTDGYVAEIGYTYGYYTELNPERLALAFLNAAYVLPKIHTACELGFGQGVSVNLHAAASNTQWYGTDFNPAQADFAQELAAVANSGARLSDESFAEFCAREDLPDFDYIGLHGIWSWISDENRQTIVDFLRRKLKVGGVLYISYNTLPGWAAMVPMRHLLTEHAEVMGASGRGIVSRIDAALDFADRFIATNPLYTRANPHVAERIKQIKGQNRQYLAHEYFNRDWHPIHFSEMAAWLAPAKLDFACSAHYLDHVDAVNLTSDQAQLLNEIPDRHFRETVRDFMVNQQFRRDYWVKGARKLSPLEQAERLREVSVMLTNPRADVTFKAVGALGDASLNESIYQPILDILASHRPCTLGDLENALADLKLPLGSILQTALVLAAKGDLAVVQQGEVVNQVRDRTTRLNQYLIDKARGQGDIAYLASPVTGGGVSVTRFQQLFLLARRKGKTTLREWAEEAWAYLAAQGQHLVKEGKAIESPEENLAELHQMAADFAEKQLPILMALGIAD